MKQLKSLFFVSVIILMQSCAAFKKENQSLENTSWKLENIAGFEGEALEKPATIKVTNKGVEGYTGCNGYNGQLKLRGESIMISEIIGTFKSCQPGSKTEAMFLETLKKADAYKIKKGKLILMSNSKEIATFEQLK